MNACRGNFHHIILKINVDTSVNFISGKAATGFIARDSSSLVLGACSHRIGFCSPLFAELWAIKFGLEWGWNKGFRQVILETDSKLPHQIMMDLGLAW